MGLEAKKKESALEIIGTVRRQSVEEGEIVDKGTEIVLTVI